MSISSIREFILSIPKFLSKNPSSDVLTILSRSVNNNEGGDDVFNFGNHIRQVPERNLKVQMKLIDRNKINFQ